ALRGAVLPAADRLSPGAAGRRAAVAVGLSGPLGRAVVERPAPRLQSVRARLQPPDRRPPRPRPARSGARSAPLRAGDGGRVPPRRGARPADGTPRAGVGLRGLPGGGL